MYMYVYIYIIVYLFTYTTRILYIYIRITYFHEGILANMCVVTASPPWGLWLDGVIDQFLHDRSGHLLRELRDLHKR